MQISTTRSKLFLLAVLSCVFLLAYESPYTGLTHLGSVNIYDHSSFQPVITLWDIANAQNESDDDDDTDTATLTNDNTIWNSLRPQFRIDHKVNNAQVQSEIRKLLADKEKLQEILTSAAPYIYYIHSQAIARHLPSELALIPVIESEFNPNDHSKKGATGLWQLMPGTAHELGVTVKKSYDGRRNVVASTNAALAYFKDLGMMFKDNWYLAIAAYNCGQFKVFHAQKRAGGTTNFWDLKLPKETRLYVPKLLAVAEIVKHPEKYGVTLPPITNTPYFAQLQMKKPVTLESVAKTTGTDISLLKTLNPDYKQPVVPTKGMYTLLVPVTKADIAKANLLSNNIVSLSI